MKYLLVLSTAVLGALAMELSYMEAAIWGIIVGLLGGMWIILSDEKGTDHDV